MSLKTTAPGPSGKSRGRAPQVRGSSGGLHRFGEAVRERIGVIVTGTRSTMGLKRKPLSYLRLNAVVELGVNGLGRQTPGIC